MQCWMCGATLSIAGKISFRATCDTCRASLHCCKNCIFYEPGRANDCKIPDTDFISDRTANNFCEDFSMLGTYAKKISKEDAKKRFDDLFK